jgi:copper transport protein
MLLTASAAWGHAAMRSTDPADGAALATSPGALTVTFNEPVVPISVRLIGVDGDIDPGGQPADHNGALTLPLGTTLPDGHYLLSWRVTSLDGHPVAGSIHFTVGHPAGAAGVPLEVAEVGGATLWLPPAVRFVLLLSLVVGAGAALSRGLGIVPRDEPIPRTIMRWSAAVGIVAAVFSVGLAGVELVGAPVSALANGPAWQVGWAAAAGTRAVWAVGGFLILAVASLPGGRLASLLGLVGAAVSAAAVALTNHAGTVEPVWIGRAALWVHMLAASLWVGAFLPLASVLRRRPAPEAAAVLGRFSVSATAGVAFLVLAGAILMVIQLALAGEGTADELWTTDWGVRLLAKLALVLVMLALAGLNRWRLVPLLERGAATARRALLRSIGLEGSLAALVIAITVTLSLVPPPRALVAATILAADACDAAPAIGGMPGMDHGAMDMAGMAGMDHGSMDMGGMDMGSMDMGSMDMGSMDMAGMDMAGMPGMDHDAMGEAAADHLAMDQVAAGLRPGRTATVADRRVTAGLTVMPACAGANQLMIMLADPQGQPLKAAAVDAVLSMPDKGVEPMIVAMQPAAGGPGGMYLGDTAAMILPGVWQIRLDVLIDDFTKVQMPAQIEIRPRP